jgi:ATP adenylyltransferase
MVRPSSGYHEPPTSINKVRVIVPLPFEPADARFPLADKPFALSVLPFASHVRRLALPSSATHTELEPALAQAFIELLDLCISTIRHADDSSEAGSGLSYNVVLTLQHLYVFPRRRESHTLAESGEPLSVNALGFAGYLLVKSEAELHAVRTEGPTNVLKAVAWESVHDLQVGGGPEFDGDVT